MCNNTGNAGAAVDTPLPTVTTGNRNYMVAPSLIQYHSETASDEVRGQELNEPLMTVDTSPRYALSVAHIMKNYGGNYQGAGSGADKPLDTVTAHDHNSLVTAHILTMRNNMDGQPADEPLATITAGGSHHAEVQAFLVKYFSNGTPKPVDSPLDTVTTKDRFALVTIHGEEYIITDIKMRMLQPRELFNAQGFPEDYIIDHDDTGKPDLLVFLACSPYPVKVTEHLFFVHAAHLTEDRPDQGQCGAWPEQIPRREPTPEHLRSPEQQPEPP